MNDTQTELMTLPENEFKPQPIKVEATGNMAVESSRAAMGILGAIHAAKQFRRDEFTAFSEIMTACERISLALKAEYIYPRGGQSVSGPSIRLAETCAQSWGNLDYGIEELDRNEVDGWSDMLAFCWDLQKNTRREIKFRVEHKRDTKQGSYRLKDQRDIYETTANQGARRLRACILGMIPGDVVEKAVLKCRETVKKGDGRPLQDRIRDAVVAFGKVGVPQDAIEKRLKHAVGSANADELADLIGIYNTIKDNLKTRSDFFDLADTQTDDNKAANDRILGGGKK